MTSFVLIPGAGGAAWYWHRVVPLLKAAGHDAVAVDLPGDDERAGLAAYTQRVVEAIGSNTDVVLVAHSLGGFTAPLVCNEKKVGRLIFVNAMIPKPGETAGDWWGNMGSDEARTKAAQRGGYSPEFDLETYFLHDVPPEVAAEGEQHERPEANVIFGEPCRFEAWPNAPIHAIASREDRFFPVEFSGGWRASDWASTSTKFQAATSWRCRSRRLSSTSCSPTFADCAVEAGSVGVWTEADSVTYFDGLVSEPL